MYTLVAYYSLTGRTHYEAKRIAEETRGELYEVREQKHRSLWSAYLLGPAQARRRKAVVIEPFALKMDEYEKVIILCPIWGGYPAPAFNSIVRELVPGQDVRIILTSDSGRARDLDGLKKRVELQGVRVSEVSVIKTMDLKKRDKRHEKRVSEQGAENGEQ